MTMFNEKFKHVLWKVLKILIVITLILGIGFWLLFMPPMSPKQPHQDVAAARCLSSGIRRYIDDTNDVSLMKLTKDNELTVENIIWNLMYLKDDRDGTYIPSYSYHDDFNLIEDFYRPQKDGVEGWEIVIYMKSRKVTVEPSKSGNSIKFIEYE